VCRHLGTQQEQEFWRSTNIPQRLNLLKP
jgi:hypothetical protein